MKRALDHAGFFIPLIIWTVVILLLVAISASAARHKYAEKIYQNQWCAEYGGKTEVTLFDRTRVDCLTEEYAIEFDFAPKWAEAIGQARYYAIITGKRPGVVLILEKEKERRFVGRLEKASPYMRIWLMRPADIK